MSKRSLIILIVLLLIAGGGVAFYFHLRKHEPPPLSEVDTFLREYLAPEEVFEVTLEVPGESSWLETFGIHRERTLLVASYNRHEFPPAGSYVGVGVMHDSGRVIQFIFQIAGTGDEQRLGEQEIKRRLLERFPNLDRVLETNVYRSPP